MTTATALILIAVVVIIVAVVGWMLFKKQRSQKLRSHFGPEYDRAYQQLGGAAKAEDALAARQKRMEKVKIHPLSDTESANLWHGVQSRFVDDPAGSIREADGLVTDVMVARGYPMADFARRADDISVDYPHVVSNYRVAHEIAEGNQTAPASTEDLRNAVVCYRKLFDELLEGHAVPGR
jgi:hypothetical protein